MLKIFEIYQSIQGESSYTGLPCTFIRLAGCPLRCEWCDSEYAFYGGNNMSITSIIEEVEKKNNQLVLITGGEPLAQHKVHLLADLLVKKQYKTLIETSGSFSITSLPQEVIAIIDIKCPSSKMTEKMYWQNLYNLRSNDEIKFVVANEEDFLWACDIVEKYNLYSNRIMISPVWGVCDMKKIAKLVLDSGKNFYLHTQLHKTIWSGETRSI